MADEGDLDDEVTLNTSTGSPVRFYPISANQASSSTSSSRFPSPGRYTLISGTFQPKIPLL
jgi:hypothetical protein